MKKSKLVISNKNGIIKSDAINEDFRSILKVFDADTKNESFRPDIIYHQKSLSEIDEDIKFVKNIYTNCVICLNQCQVNRIAGQKGICGNDQESYIYKNQIEFGEEVFISPSYMLYFTGCNMICFYCHQKEDLLYNENYNYTPSQLIIKDIMEKKDDMKTISFVGGNVEQSLLGALDFIRTLMVKEIFLPVVWNSNITCSTGIINILNRYIDVFIPDFKFGKDNCAVELSRTKDYVEIVDKNLGSLQSKNPIIVRHLPLKGHFDCCTRPIIKRLSRIRDKILVNFQISLYDDNDSEREKALKLGIESGLLMVN